MERRDMDELAKDIAIKAHNGQFRRDGVTPYITHPEQVANFFIKGSNANKVGWLHDVVEDTNVSLLELKEQGFTCEVIDAIDLLTHRESQSYVKYILAINSNKIAKTVKLADMHHNLLTATKRQKDKYLMAWYILTGCLWEDKNVKV